MSNDWTDADMIRLRQCVAECMTGRQIAEVLGRSRNAVIGKMNREGIRSTSINPMSRPQIKKPRVIRVLRAKASPIWQNPLSFTVDPIKVRFMDLKRNHCRWLLDEPDDMGLPLSCGVRSLKGCSYCPAHARIVYQPPTRR